MTKEQEKISENLSLLAKSSLIVFIGIFLSKLFTYLYKIVIGRYYGPEEYGVFSIAIMILGIFVAFASLGLSDGLNRFLPIFIAKKNQKNISYIIHVSKKIFLFTGIIFAFVLFFFSEIISLYLFNEPRLSIYLKIFSFVIPIQLYTYIYYSIIRSYEKISIYSFGINVLQNFVKLLFIFLLIFLGVSASKSVSWSYFIGIFVMFLFGYISCKQLLSLKLIENFSTSKETKKHLFKEIFSYSWPLFLFSILSSFIFWIDTFSIGVLKDSYFVGIYNAAISIAFLLMVSSEIFMQLFFPLITKELFLKRNQVVSEISKQIVKWTFIINLPLLFLIYFFPGVFINFFWGKEYLFASNSLRFLAIGYFVFSLASVSINLLSSKGKSKLILLNLLFVSVLNLCLNFILIPIYSIEGAAFATMISLILWSVFLFIESYLFVGVIPLRRKLLTVFFSAIAPAIFLFYFQEYFNFGIYGLILFLGVYGGVYILLIFLTNSLDKNDLMIVGKIYSKFKESKITNNFLKE